MEKVRNASNLTAWVKKRSQISKAPSDKLYAINEEVGGREGGPASTEARVTNVMPALSLASTNYKDVNVMQKFNQG